MHRHLNKIYLVLSSAVLLQLFPICQSSARVGIPLQPDFPYIYGIQTPFDIIRAWIGIFQ